MKRNNTLITFFSHPESEAKLKFFLPSLLETLNPVFISQDKTALKGIDTEVLPLDEKRFPRIKDIIHTKKIEKVISFNGHLHHEANFFNRHLGISFQNSDFELIDKWQLHCQLTKLGLPRLESYLISEMPSVKDRQNWVIKLTRSTGSLFMKKVGKTELKDVVETLLPVEPWGEWMIQEFRKGRQIGCEVLFQKGKVIPLFCHEMTFDSSFKAYEHRGPVSFPRSCHEILSTLAEVHQFDGFFASPDFILDSNEAYLIDFNPTLGSESIWPLFEKVEPQALEIFLKGVKGEDVSYSIDTLNEKQKWIAERKVSEWHLRNQND